MLGEFKEGSRGVYFGLGRRRGDVKSVWYIDKNDGGDMRGVGQGCEGHVDMKWSGGSA